jgi:hypothetical protein
MNRIPLGKMSKRFTLLTGFYPIYRKPSFRDFRSINQTFV